MAQNTTANDRAIFHLVPTGGSQDAEEALTHPDNQPFVSLSADNTPGLEVGFHIPPMSHGNVITRLGRNTDLILHKSFSAVHVAFEIHPETLVVMLSVRTKGNSSVSITVDEEGRDEQAISGDCALLYGQEYCITIASYVFRLVWRHTKGPDRVQSLKDLATKGYQDAMQRLQDVSSRYLSIPDISTDISWHKTRLQSAKAPLVTELPGCRVLIGQGGFGKVYKTIDRRSGNYFAVKEVDLSGQAGAVLERGRTALHREIKILKTLEHEHIIECLGTMDFDTHKPLIFMPLRQGSLHSLTEGGTASDGLCSQVLGQMLRALDYLAFHNYCHRDVKPQNILYQILRQDDYLFQLADFGLANDFRDAKTNCGTMWYVAPEVHNGGPQTSKMDIWSLFATMAEIIPGCEFPPEAGTYPGTIIKAVQEAAAKCPILEPMARTDPKRRASAAQMLVDLFDSKGLTTPKDQIPPMQPDVPQPMPLPLAQAAPRPAPPPTVIEYRRSRRQQGLRPLPSTGILPNRLPATPLLSQPTHATLKGGIKKQPALQAKPQGRLLQAMQSQAEGAQPWVSERQPQEEETLAMQRGGAVFRPIQPQHVRPQGHAYHAGDGRPQPCRPEVIFAIFRRESMFSVASLIKQPISRLQLSIPDLHTVSRTVSSGWPACLPV